MEYVLTFNGFRDALRDGKFLGLKCEDCGAYTVPPMKVCSNCTSENMKVFELSGNGELRTFSVVYVVAEGFESPCIVAEVELEEGPWVTTTLLNVKPDPKTMDLPMDIIGRKGKIGHRDVPANEFSAGERIALTFTLEA